MVNAAARKKRDRTSEKPVWEVEVDSEITEQIVEHVEDEQLSEVNRNNMENIRNVAVDEMDAFLDETILSLERVELDAPATSASSSLLLLRERSDFSALAVGSSDSRRSVALYAKGAKVSFRAKSGGCASRWWPSCFNTLQLLLQQVKILRNDDALPLLLDYALVAGV
ncbi:hypothetical protein PF006_g3034 [Phytophthora fragariae]|uniref:Uncharacterized protein n=1 Tax=Phytophthora fragariae TaxID=53985 RepID=A0A6A3FYW2_9STRA|nr:hypothetical protein PF009_g3500 [Phytophthora fragariae]KAE9026211.1 hypothetical protein PF011_g2671 [Phytophthora fragariae]KAE9152777.1 hypothetical protein PF006_g3034 [Phytophthora fragariae]